MVAVSPFPLLPVFVWLVSVPQPGVQLVPLLVKVQLAPAKLPLLWSIDAVKTVCVPDIIDVGVVSRVSSVVLVPTMLFSMLLTRPHPGRNSRKKNATNRRAHFGYCNESSSSIFRLN
jgi:hypothetical protein